MSFIVASASYEQSYITSLDELARKWRKAVGEAVQSGAQMLVFPEYGAIEATPIFSQEAARDLKGQIEASTVLREDLAHLMSKLAQEYGVYILGPSAPVLDDGRAVNQVQLFGPGGEIGTQQKLVVTVFEHSEWGVSGGDGLSIFETEFGLIAVLICYDCELPLLARKAVMAGARLLLVPSSTDTLAGYWRVRIGSMARALEGQCFVAHSALIGEASWSPSTDINIGMAGIYGPPDKGLPDNGLLGIGEMNMPGWTFAELDFDLLDQIRDDGDVRPFTDWALTEVGEKNFHLQHRRVR